MYCVTVLPSKLTTMRSDSAHIVVVTSDAALAETLRQNLLDGLKDVVKKPEIDVSTDTSDAGRDELVARVSQGNTADFFGHPKTLSAQEKVTYNARSTSDFVEKQVMKDSLQKAVMHERLLQHGFPAERSRPF